MLFNQETVNRKYFRSGPDPQLSRFFWKTYFVLKTFRRRFFLEERHIVLTHHQHIPEAFARVSLLERGSLGVELLSTSSGGGNHHLLISSCKYTHTHTQPSGPSFRPATTRSWVWGDCWCMCVLAARTAGDAGVHLSEAWVSLLREQGFCLVNVLPRLVYAAANIGHRDLRERNQKVVRSIHNLFIFAIWEL